MFTFKPMIAYLELISYGYQINRELTQAMMKS